MATTRCIEHIGLATDFSPEAEVAFEQAVELTLHTGARLTLIHVCESGAAKVMEEPDRERLSAWSGRAESRGVTPATHVAFGRADTSVCAAALRLGVDLVVTGTHGRTGAGRALLGSVAERVTRLADCNVMVARAGATGRDGFGRIFVPTDFSLAAERALGLAVELAADGAAVDVVHFWSRPSLAGGAPAAEMRHNTRAAVDRLAADSRARFAGAAVDLRFRLEEYAAVEGIVSASEADGCELVVMGTHGHRGVRRYLLGSVAEATVRHAACSVLVAHGG